MSLQVIKKAFGNEICDNETYFLIAASMHPSFAILDAIMKCNPRPVDVSSDDRFSERAWLYHIMSWEKLSVINSLLKKNNISSLFWKNKKEE